MLKINFHRSDSLVENTETTIWFNYVIGTKGNIQFTVSNRNMRCAYTSLEGIRKRKTPFMKSGRT